MARVEVFRDPLKETQSYKLSDLYRSEDIGEDTEFTILRLFSPKVQDFIAARGRAEPGSIWERWSKDGMRSEPCPSCGEDESKRAECVPCNGSGKVFELTNSVPLPILASLMAAVTVRANPLRVDVAENGDAPEFKLWDTRDHEDERQALLADVYRDLPELTIMLLVRSYEAQAAYAKAYEATRKNSPASSLPKQTGRGRRAKKSSG